MEKPARTQFPVHDLVARRWSPRAFDERPIALDLFRTVGTPILSHGIDREEESNG